MHLEALMARARAQPAAGPVDMDRLGRELLAFFARIPEPPVYRRRDDPAVARAVELLEEAPALLARALAAWPPGEPWRAALEGHLEALCLLSEHRVEAVEPVWQQAVLAERRAAAGLKLWRRSDEGPRPVYDAATGQSRFDPRPDAMVVASLACPWCRVVAEYQFSTEAALHALGCTHCHRPFTAYFAEVRRAEAALSGKRRSYVFRVEELSGAQTRVEFDDFNAEVLTAAPGDLVAFLYAPQAVLRGVLNLNSSRVLWLGSAGPCFVATVAFGEGAPELEVLRRFRDTRLATSGPGRGFVRWYYRHGPALARTVKASPLAHAAARAALARVVAHLEARRG
jgi:hypothetical protein